MTNKLKTPLPDLDRVMSGGFTRGAYTLITGYTGFGKTAISCQIAGTLMQMGVEGLFVSLDESMARMVPRMYSCFGGVPYEKFTRSDAGPRTPNENEAIARVKGSFKLLAVICSNTHRRLKNEPFIIPQDLDRYYDNFLAKGRSPKFVVIDPITIDSSEWSRGDEVRAIEVSMRAVGEFLADFAHRRNVAVIATAQSKNTIQKLNYSTPFYTCYAKRLGEHAEFSLCMSAKANPIDQSAPEILGFQPHEVYESVQNISVHEGCGRLLGRVFMKRDLGYQRFIPA